MWRPRAILIAGMRRLPIIVGLFAVAAVAVPATAQTPERAVSLAASTQLIKYNKDPVQLTGQLTGVQNPANLVNQRVTLRSAIAPYRQFRTRARGRTAADGTFSFTVQPGENVRYDAGAAARRSPPVQILVMRQVTIKLSSGTPRRGGRLRISGYSYPKRDGDAVDLQFGDGTNWTTVQRGRFYDVGSTRSGYRFTVPTPRRRTLVRVVAPDTPRWVTSPSSSRSVRPRA
jgi:hypothetical protein